MKAHKIFVLFFLLIQFFVKISAQPACHFEHYSTEDGLPQYTIMDILQDRKGFMWFGTWDGFSKFDGHSFKNYKVQSGDTYYMRSNRIEHMYEDAYGNIWLLSYDKEAHCFNPEDETFKGVRSIPEYKNHSFQLAKLETKPSGKVWLLSERNGCICITDSLFSSQVYNADNSRLKGDIVHTVFEDSDKNSWLLTNNGISLIKNDEFETNSYFFANGMSQGVQAFYAAIEMGDAIWFGSGSGRIWKYTKSTEKFDLFELPAQSDITGFQLLSGDEICISTSSNGFFVLGMKNDTLKQYNKFTAPELKSNRINFLFYDSLEQLWFETDELGIYKFNTKTQEIKYFFVKTEDVAISVFPPIAEVLEDIYGEIWVHPRGGGLSYYDKTLDTLLPFYNDESKSDWKFSNILHASYSDKQGNLWLSTRSHGLEKVVFDGNSFKTLRINPTITSIANDVRAVLQDDDNNIWIATKNRQLSIYDENYNKIGNFSDDGTIRPNQLFPGAVYSMMQDEAENIWIGTKGAGLFKVKKTAKKGQYLVEQFRTNPNDIFSLSEDVIYSIYQDGRKNIWIGTYGGGLNLVAANSKGETVFINHRNNLKNYPIETGHRIRFISENSYGNICVGTTSGLVVFSASFEQPDDIEYQYYTREPGKTESLANNDIHGICNTQKGDMYIATFGGGLNKVISHDNKGFPTAFKAYTVQDGLPFNVCLAVLEDEQGNLWVSMENNLSKFNPEEEVFETFAEVKRIMASHNFSEASACRLKNNELVFGFSNGVVHFLPEEIKNNQFKPHIVFSDFRIFNRPVNIAAPNSPLDKNIDDVENLVLTHKQNFFSIEYATLDFVSPDNILYAYKLDGFDQEWVYVQKQRIANYTNIPKGEYTFKVKSTNSEGAWVDNERTLSIKVLPSFWETSWSYILYAVAFFSILYIIMRVLFSFYQLKNNVEIEKQLSEMKLRFFTDISHEIRTPLTMISAPINYLIEESDTPEKVKTQLNLVSQNTNRLLRLVNQILDFRKVQHIHLKIQETDLGAFVENTAHSFDELIKENNISFKFINQAKGESVWVDRDCLEKIIVNLLSNAFKYTPAGKLIQVSVLENEKYLSVEVKDQGKGISKEKQKDLFARFSSFNEDKSKPSTGIGLFIVNDLVTKHEGKITVESELGKGSVFTVSFLRGLSHFGDNAEIISKNADEKATAHAKSGENAGTDTSAETPHEESSDKRKTILIVEDDADLRGFIRTILEKDHRIIEAEDGIDGLKKTEKYNPDFIVSDIMMPRMDGIEFLQKIRENINTSHIPIILLTAKTTLESKLEGLEYGADDYITKPFSVPYFRARIDNLLERRKHLQEIYFSHLASESTPEFEPQPFVITSQDKTLMKNVVRLIEENMDNSDFTVEELSVNIGMSRSVFFNKIKGLTGFAPLEFIRDIKMKRAAQLLSSGEFMVKEVSFMIGISDTKYFGKCFKAKYGMTPQEYKTKFQEK
jgi:signal transduction histidine kinase/DNA-binding response OmpR family regulator/ligand-binding sensor domain-containing protein